MLADVRDTALRGKELWLAWIVAMVATLGSLYFSEILDFVPCRMCWFQRIGMYPLTVVLLVGALRRDVRSAVQYAFVFPIAGSIASIYHIYIENNPGAESASCKVGVPCSVKWIDQFGYITIPTLCLTAFALIGALLWFAWSRREPASAA
jgi:disulfide bond formation protein DsbB